MPSILFVCTGNRCRSPLAAALFTHCLEERKPATKWLVASAGTWAVPGLPAEPLTQTAARGLGLDLQSHRTRRVEQVSLRDFDLIVVMEAGQKEALLVEFPELGEKVHLLTHLADEIMDIPDPMGAGLSVHTEVANDLAALVSRAFDRICDLANGRVNPELR